MKAILDLSFTAGQLAAPGTALSAQGEPGNDAASWVCIVASLTGLTGGTLDITIQDSPNGTDWYDYARFAQVSAAAAKASFAFTPALPNAFVAIGNPTTDPATPVPALAAGTSRGGHPMAYIRAVAVAGAGVSVGAAQTIKVFSR